MGRMVLNLIPSCHLVGDLWRIRADRVGMGSNKPNPLNLCGAMPARKGLSHGKGRGRGNEGDSRWLYCLIDNSLEVSSI